MARLTDDDLRDKLANIDFSYQAHGPTKKLKDAESGLRVYVSNGHAEVTEWTCLRGYDDDAEERGVDPGFSKQSASVPLTKLLDAAGKHRGVYGGKHWDADWRAVARMGKRDQKAAISWLGYWGGDEDQVADLFD